MKRATESITLVLYLCLGFTALSFVAFAAFGRSNSDDWAAFGDFVGGVTNPLIGIANLVLLVVISYQLADRDDRRNMISLKHQALLEFGKLLKYTPRPMRTITQEDFELYAESWERYSAFIRDWAYLFPGLQKEFSSLFFLAIALGNSVNAVYQYHSRGLQGSPDAIAAFEKLEHFYADEYTKGYQLLLSKMQSHMEN